MRAARLWTYAPGIDTAGHDSIGGAPSRAHYDSLRAGGIAWVARYLRISDDALDEPDMRGGDHAGCWSLSRAELECILDAGLALVPIQWGPASGDRIGLASGGRKGYLAAMQARALGLPEGVHLWCDLEGGAAARAGRHHCIRYVTAWARAVMEEGYRAGLYIGDAGVPLSGRDLYGLPRVSSYWRSAVDGLQDPYPRGWAIVQSPPDTIAGVPCDRDIMVRDWRGDLPWVVTA